MHEPTNKVGVSAHLCGGYVTDDPSDLFVFAGLSAKVLDELYCFQKSSDQRKKETAWKQRNTRIHGKR